MIVSIPVRFDWESNSAVLTDLSDNVSIPVRFDWERPSKAPFNVLVVCFNSCKVRLGGSIPFFFNSAFAVSIPVRFDWENILICDSKNPSSVSIPVRFDWE